MSILGVGKTEIDVNYNLNSKNVRRQSKRSSRSSGIFSSAQHTKKERFITGLIQLNDDLKKALLDKKAAPTETTSIKVT